jgi:hypothetical protein
MASSSEEQKQAAAPSVTLTYWIRGERTVREKFNESHVKPARIGLAEGRTPVKVRVVVRGRRYLHFCCSVCVQWLGERERDLLNPFIYLVA